MKANKKKWNRPFIRPLHHLIPSFIPFWGIASPNSDGMTLSSVAFRLYDLSPIRFFFLAHCSVRRRLSTSFFLESQFFSWPLNDPLKVSGLGYLARNGLDTANFVALKVFKATWITSKVYSEWVCASTIKPFLASSICFLFARFYIKLITLKGWHIKTYFCNVFYL